MTHVEDEETPVEENVKTFIVSGMVTLFKRVEIRVETNEVDALEDALTQLAQEEGIEVDNCQWSYPDDVECVLDEYEWSGYIFAMPGLNSTK